MKNKYKGSGLFFLTILIFSGCSKDSYYPVDNEIKPYFVFQPGSYWIYENDSTGSIDSVWANGTFSPTSDFDNTSKPTQLITVNLKSSFLVSIQLFGQRCEERYAVFVSTFVFDDTSESNSVAMFPVFFPDWLPEKQNIQDPCVSYFVDTFRFILSDTINNSPFENILYTYSRSKDSSLTNSRFHSREIWIAKNVGIIKIIEKYRNYNTERSYSLLRYHVKQ